MHGAGSYKDNGRKKGGAKAHVLLKANEDIPVFVRITEGKRNDQVIMKDLPLPQGSVIVMDKAYTSSQVQSRWTKNNITWVTRIRNLAKVEIIEEFNLDDSSKQVGILSDKKIRLGRASNKSTSIQQVRLIEFYDNQSDRKFEFITNNFKLSPWMIAQIYKQRWQIELMFKRLKSNFPLRYFLGDNPNAIKSQMKYYSSIKK